MTAMARDIRREHRHPRGQSKPILSVPVPGIGVCQGEGADPPCALSLPHQQGHPMLQRDRHKGHSLAPLLPALPTSTLAYRGATAGEGLATACLPGTLAAEPASPTETLLLLLLTLWLGCFPKRIPLAGFPHPSKPSQEAVMVRQQT